MTPTYQDKLTTLYPGDCRAVMAALPENSVDTILTDPPYHLTTGKKGGTGMASNNPNSPAGRSRIGTGNNGAGGGFMGKDWDGGDVAFDPATWAAALRVAKPGAMLLAFGGTRTWHRLACAIEDAGWEIRDTIMWLYGSGFPKSLDISKAIDKAAGAERQAVGRRRTASGTAVNDGTAFRDDNYQWKSEVDVTVPATDAAKLWAGWGTALKPAWEPVIVAMKPLDGTFAANAQKWGVAGLNIDGGRIHTAGSEAKDYTVTRLKPGATLNKTGGNWRPEEGGVEYNGTTKAGRWPANAILSHHPDCVAVGTGVVKGDPRGACDGKRGGRPGGFGDVGAERGDGMPNAKVYGDAIVPVFDCHPECPVRILDEQSGTLVSNGGKGPHTIQGTAARNDNRSAYGDYGPSADRVYGDRGGASRFFYTAKASRADRGAGNTHATVKPLALMRYLLKLTQTPLGDGGDGGVVLDPFAGSGSTLVAARAMNRRSIGIELKDEHCAICAKRLEQGVLNFGTAAEGEE